MMKPTPQTTRSPCHEEGGESKQRTENKKNRHARSASRRMLIIASLAQNTMHARTRTHIHPNTHKWNNTCSSRRGPPCEAPASAAPSRGWQHLKQATLTQMKLVDSLRMLLRPKTSQPGFSHTEDNKDGPAVFPRRARLLRAATNPRNTCAFKKDCNRRHQTRPTTDAMVETRGRGKKETGGGGERKAMTMSRGVAGVRQPGAPAPVTELMPLRTPMAAPTIAAGSAGLAGRSTVVDSFATLLKPSANHTRCKQDIRTQAIRVEGVGAGSK